LPYFVIFLERILIKNGHKFVLWVCFKMRKGLVGSTLAMSGVSEDIFSEFQVSVQSSLRCRVARKRPVSATRSRWRRTRLGNLPRPKTRWQFQLKCIFLATRPRVNFIKILQAAFVPLDLPWSNWHKALSVGQCFSTFFDWRHPS